MSSRGRKKSSLGEASDAAIDDLRKLLGGGDVLYVVKRPSMKALLGLAAKQRDQRQVTLVVLGHPRLENTTTDGEEAYACRVVATTRTLELRDVDDVTHHVSRGVITFTGVHSVSEPGGGHYSVYTTRTTYKVELSISRPLLGTVEKVAVANSSSGI